ncbi:MAG: outer membrane beta-barrel protein [Pseudomonadota bacterium]
MKKIAFILALAIASLSQNAAAQDMGKQLRFTLGAGLTFGGDKLATASYVNGGDIDIRAGSMVALTAGVDYRITPEVSLQALVGYHVDNASATNGDVRFQRFPIELLAYYNVAPQWRIGGGVRYVSSPKLSSSGAAYIGNYTFDDTVSGVLETEYAMSNVIGIKVRYVQEEFKHKYSNNKVSGSHAGVFANFYF